MKQARASIGEAVVSVLIKPFTRWLARRARRRMAQRARTTIVVPLEDLWQTAISGPVAKAMAHGIDVTSFLGGAETLRGSGVREERHVARGLAIALAVAVLVAGLAFILAAILRSRRRPAAAASTTDGPIAIPVSTAPERVEAAADRTVGAGMQVIKGIGPETARRLADIGVHSVEQVAAWGADDVDRIAGRLGIAAARIEHEDWIGQARAAAGVVRPDERTDATTRA